MKRSKYHERSLFFTLWIFIILAMAFWVFWPHHKSQTHPENIAVVLAPSLLPWFISGKVREGEPGRYILNLSLSSKYLKSLQNHKQTILLSFMLEGKKGRNYSSSASCYLNPEKSEAIVILPNPEGIEAKTIHFDLLK